MVRPKKKRLIRFEPGVTYFKPRGIPLSELKEVRLGLDELEALRLCDFLGLDQVKAAKKMKISQSTLQRTLIVSRKKIIQALIKGLAIRVKGGEYQMPRGFGRGLSAGRQGRMGGPLAAGPGGECQCTNPKCGYTISHRRAVPCMRMKCPKCSSPMTRKS